jgi:hypothetical protein
VRLETKAVAEDIYADTVELEEKAEAARVFGRRVVLGENSSVAEVVYTETLETREGARVRTPPQKVAQLPPFPL